MICTSFLRSSSRTTSRGSSQKAATFSLRLPRCTFARVRIHAKPHKISHLIFSNRNTLPCCGWQVRFPCAVPASADPDGGPPCLVASLPRDSRHYGFLNRDIRLLEFRATPEKCVTYKILIETKRLFRKRPHSRGRLCHTENKPIQDKPAGETPAPRKAKRWRATALPKIAPRSTARGRGSRWRRIWRLAATRCGRSSPLPSWPGRRR